MPSFLTPDFGLLFWMLIAFLVVFVLLAKYGFPVITDMVEKRKAYIDESLAAARQANEKLANIKAECQAMIQETQTRQSQILKEAGHTRDQIVEEAKQKAQQEANRILEDARRQIKAETEKAQRDMRSQVADLSIQIAAKILSRSLQKDEEQMQWVDRILDQVAEKK
ncbi:MAG: F0F1 ATP synthase subunit B [Bacteroidaceae bacterium]|nr:F0F1 ATP synthase subunit B [Prevotellaceae bacterium]MDY3063947.1 F0F1 ATP synthase subunit B [Bacteroidaceae bacterium]